MKRCVVVKMFGDQDLANAIAPVFADESEQSKTEEYKELEEKCKRLTMERDAQVKKVEEYYRNKIKEAEREYAVKKQNRVKTWLATMAAVGVIFLGNQEEIDEETRILADRINELEFRHELFKKNNKIYGEDDI